MKQWRRNTRDRLEGSIGGLLFVVQAVHYPEQNVTLVSGRLGPHDVLLTAANDRLSGSFLGSDIRVDLDIPPVREIGARSLARRLFAIVQHMLDLKTEYDALDGEAEALLSPIERATRRLPAAPFGWEVRETITPEGDELMIEVSSSDKSDKANFELAAWSQWWLKVASVLEERGWEVREGYPTETGGFCTVYHRISPIDRDVPASLEPR